MADTNTLADAVTQAVETAEKPAKETTETTETKETPVENKEEKTPTGLSEDQLKEATQLYTLLQDPQKAPAVVDWLARQAGYDKVKVETKQEVKEVKKDIKDVLKERLGPELEFLADKLAPAIDDILKDKLEEHTSDIRETIQQGELDKLATQSDKALTTLSKDFFGEGVETPKEVIDRINELVDEMPPAKGVTVEKYMSNLFHIAVGEKGLVKKSANSVSTERANKNRTDAPSRLASERGTRSQEGVIVPKTKMNLVDAVNLAVETVNKQQKT